MKTTEKYDFAVIGSGFGGSIMSMILRRLGHSVALLERGTHPRFAIGESSTPMSNLILEVLAARFDLPFLKHLSEWGSWQRYLPELAAGLKRGFTFYHHAPGIARNPLDRSTELLVAASPRDAVADAHWYRPGVDAFLAARALELGVAFFDRFDIRQLTREGMGWRISSADRALAAGFIIDASGFNGIAGRFLGIPNQGFKCMPRTRAVYAHFGKVAPSGPPAPGMPYPPESAAVHHVFAGGWVWVLRFNNGLTSAGAAYAGRERCWEEILEAMPSVKALFQGAELVTPLFGADPLSFRRLRAAGAGFALLPSAAGFVDPLLSTGFALNLLGIMRLAESMEGSDAYEAQTFRELDAVADLVSALYSKMGSFAEFARLTLLYFAAMSYTETCWRLGRERLARGFLLCDDARFSEKRRQLCALARRGGAVTREQIEHAIRDHDVAGLSKGERGPWHPVDFNDLIEARGKIGASLEEIEALVAKLNRAG